MDTDRGWGRVESARSALAQHRWDVAAADFAAADVEGVLGGEDLVGWANAAYLVGDRDACRRALVRAHRWFAGRAAVHDAVRCGFWVSFILLDDGETGQAAGWLTRCRHLLGGGADDGPGHGYLLVFDAFEASALGRDPGRGRDLARRAVATGRAHDDLDLVTLGLGVEGRSRIRAGDVAEGLARLDEAMVFVASEEVSAVVAGTVYCSAIEGCEEVLELGRAVEWTEALSAWCDRQRGLRTFRGQCLTHRASLLCAEGNLDAAEEEAQRACERFVGAADEMARGRAWYELAEVHRLRGDLDAAEASYRRAAEVGHDPQPGLALLRLARGRVGTAGAMVRRLLEETPDGPERLRILPAAVEVLLEADEQAADRAAAELRSLAAQVATPGALAEAATATGAVVLARGDGGAALAALRDAVGRWRGLGLSLEVARCRLLVARALTLLGDHETASAEAGAARRSLADLGVAVPRETGAGSSEPALSPREREVLALVVRGWTNRMIADELVVAVRTVDRHVANILTKLGVPSRAAATAAAYERGLLVGGEPQAPDDRDGSASPNG